MTEVLASISAGQLMVKTCPVCNTGFVSGDEVREQEQQKASGGTIYTYYHKDCLERLKLQMESFLEKLKKQKEEDDAEEAEYTVAGV